MSGRKTRTIDEREYFRLREEARKAESERRRAEAERRAKEQMEKDLRIAKTYNKDLENRIKSIGASLDATNAAASAIKQQLIDTVKKTNIALKNHESNVEKKLAAMGDTFADAMAENNRRVEQVINKNTAELRADMKALKNATHNQIAAVKAQIADLAAKVGDPGVLIAAGSDYLDIALELIGQLEGSRHALFCPGEMEKVVAAAQKAKKYIEGALANPAGASTAQLLGEQAFDAAHKLYQDVAEAESLWKAKLALALEALSAAQAEIETRETIVLKDTDGEDISLDTNYWSEGALESLKTQIAKVREVLLDEEKAKKLSFDDLDGITTLAGDICDDSAAIRDGAVFAVLSSQERVNLAYDLTNELEAQAGLTTIKAAGYEGEDMRAANLIHLKNGTTGFEVVITLKPTFENGRCGYVAETDIVNAGDNKSDADTFDEVLKDVMNRYGLAGNNPIPVNPEKKDDIKDWTERDAQTVSTVTAKPDIHNEVEKITNAATNK